MCVLIPKQHTIERRLHFVHISPSFPAVQGGPHCHTRANLDINISHPILKCIRRRKKKEKKKRGPEPILLSTHPHVTIIDSETPNSATV